MMAPLLQLPLQRTIIKGDIEIHFAEAGDGAPLVFVHGVLGDLRTWAPQWDAFTPHYRCISYSRRYSVPNENRQPSPARPPKPTRSKRPAASCAR